MRRLIRAALVAVVLSASACGAGESAEKSSAAIPTSGDGVTPAQPTDATCVTNRDCPEGSECRRVRIGDDTRSVCVAQSEPNDGLTPVPTDGGTAPPPVVDTPETPPSDGGLVFDGGDAGAVCTKTLTVKFTKTSGDTCTFNTTVRESSPSKLSYQCAGGAASATFGAQTFVGTLTNDSLSIQNVSKYTFATNISGVGCPYTATQVISGVLGSGTLDYRYTETLGAGAAPICKLTTRACSASGTVAVL